MVSDQQVRDQLELLLASETFRGKDSIRRLLSYLITHTLAGTAADLKEYTIGVECFHKPPDYDPQNDSSVRVHIAKLRDRLEYYYSVEGAAAPLILELPKRQFTFRIREPEPAPLPSPATPPPTRRAVWPWAAAALSAGFAGGWFATHRPDLALPPEVEAFWAPILAATRPAVLCLGTPMFLGYSNGLRIRMTDLNEPAAAAADPRAQRLAAAAGEDSRGPVYDYTGVGEATAAVLLDRVFARRGLSLEVRRSNSLGWDEINTRDLIVLGSTKYNPQLKDIASRTNFSADSGGIQNRAPLPGEPDRYGSLHTDDPGRPLAEHHALVARMPGLQPKNHLYVLASATTYGTWAAAQYVTQPDYLRGLAAKTANARYFEAVIRVRLRANVPLDMTFVTHRNIS